MEKSGTAFTASDTINYTYNDKSEVTGADAVTDANYNFGFDYDTIGNRKTYDTTESGSNVQSVYSTNNLNQYTNITNPSQNPTYDDDGNMLTMTLASGSWTNTYNAENRIIAQEKSDARLEYVYDYMGRRVEKKVYSGSVGNWVLDEHKRYIYNVYTQLVELDALNSNVITKKRIWAGGRIVSDIHGSNAYYAVADGNKNITAYLDNSGVFQAQFEYSPFGKQTAKHGSLTDDFDYRFSSEVFESKTGLVSYNFRFYSPELGKWLTRDLISERGGVNLYSFVSNKPINYYDFLGNEEQIYEVSYLNMDTIQNIPELEEWYYNKTLKELDIAIERDKNEAERKRFAEKCNEASDVGKLKITFTKYALSYANPDNIKVAYQTSSVTTLIATLSAAPVEMPLQVLGGQVTDMYVGVIDAAWQKNVPLNIWIKFKVERCSCFSLFWMFPIYYWKDIEDDWMEIEPKNIAIPGFFPASPSNYYLPKAEDVNFAIDEAQRRLTEMHKTDNEVFFND